MEQIKEQKNNTILWTILTLSVAGFIDATYLAMNRLIGNPVVCYGSNGCGIVDASPYSSILGIPVSVLGAIFYAVTILLLVQFFLKKEKRMLSLAAVMLIVGGVFSIYFILLQALVIHAWCYYCIISDTIGIINALLIIWLLKRK